MNNDLSQFPPPNSLHFLATLGQYRKVYRILIAAIHYPVASGRYIARAFKRLGHDVRTVGPATGNQIWGTTVDERHVWTPDFHSERQILPEWGIPDLVVWADSGLGRGNVDYFGGAPVVVWGVDNHVRDYNLGSLVYPKFDHYFLAHHDGPALPVDDSRSDMTWLPCAYDPKYFTPSPIPMAEREYDVAMVGVMYPRRAEIISAMMDAGLKVFAGTGLLYEDYRDVYHNSRISLCVSAAGDVAQRVFETAAMGCVILTDECADFGRLGFYQAGAGAVFGDTVHAVDVAQRILAGDIQLSNVPFRFSNTQGLSEQAQRWATPHTWEARAQMVLDTMFGGK